jgi:hypothetical protein
MVWRWKVATVFQDLSPYEKFNYWLDTKDSKQQRTLSSLMKMKNKTLNCFSDLMNTGFKRAFYKIANYTFDEITLL